MKYNFQWDLQKAKSNLQKHVTTERVFVMPAKAGIQCVFWYYENTDINFLSWIPAKNMREWHFLNYAEQLQKHNVSFEEATSVFDDMLSSTITDPSHPIGKNRFIQIGLSNTDKILVVVFTDRNDIIRIISARIATKQ